MKVVIPPFFQYSGGVRIQQYFALWLIVFGGLCLSAKEPKSAVRVLKVLPHYLDTKGLHALSPSLFERDAYQAHLKDHPEEVSTMRFDVHLRLGKLEVKKLRVRVEARFGKDNSIKTLQATAPVKKAKWGKRGWTPVTLGKKDFDANAQLIAWRVTLLEGEKELADQTSFLW